MFGVVIGVVHLLDVWFRDIYRFVSSLLYVCRLMVIELCGVPSGGVHAWTELIRYHVTDPSISRYDTMMQ